MKTNAELYAQKSDQVAIGYKAAMDNILSAEEKFMFEMLKLEKDGVE